MLSYLRSGSKRVKLIFLVVTVATAATFVVGFNFFGFMGRDNASSRQTGSLGAVNGEEITRSMWQGALDTERETYRERYGSNPVDRDAHAVAQQAWRRVVNARLLSQAARDAGIKVTDNDVVFGMQVNPPAALRNLPAFQTDGKFDVAKYRQALGNPSVNWAPFEDQVRLEAPANKLQERLITAVKWSESEVRELLVDRLQRMTAVVLQVPPVDSVKGTPAEADLQRVYDRYKSRMAAPAGTQLEVLAVPFKYQADEVKTAMDLATSLYQRAQAGEPFNQLCRDYSEGPNSETGGVIDRFLSPADLGPFGSAIATHKPGDVLPPIQQGGIVMVLRILDPARDSVAKAAPPGTVKLAQIVVKVHPSAESMRAQYDAASAIAKHAQSVGLGRAATEKGLATFKTGFFDLESTPQELYAAPEAADWGLTHKKGDVSPVFETPDAFYITQVAERHASGIPARAEVGERLMQIARFDARVDAAKTRADQVAAALQAGQSLEDAAKAAGLATVAANNFTRAQPDPSVASSPELQGLLWAARPGQVVGPVRSPAGWFFGRVVSVAAVPDTILASEGLRQQARQEILNRRQRTFLNGFQQTLWDRAKIVDNRSGSTF